MPVGIQLLIAFAAGGLLGFFFGWLSVRSWKITTDRLRKYIGLPPSWSTMILILFIFAIRYYFEYTYTFHPNKAAHLFLADAIVSGIFTGIFFGRSFHIYTKYQNIL